MPAVQDAEVLDTFCCVEPSRPSLDGRLAVTEAIEDTDPHRLADHATAKPALDELGGSGLGKAKASGIGVGADRSTT